MRNGIRFGGLAVLMACCLSAFAAFSIAQDAVSAKDIEVVKARIKELGSVAKLTMNGNQVTEIVVQEGSNLTAGDLALFGRLKDLQKLQIFNCRSLTTEWASKLAGLSKLTTLALTNSVIDDNAVEMIAKSFPKLVELDLSYNANMTNQILSPISDLKQLQRLTLIQTRLNEVSTRRLRQLKELQVLDLRGNMEAGDMTLEVVSELPKLKAFKHRSTAISDTGLEYLAQNAALENLLLQDFAITSISGMHLAKLQKLSQLEIFRCQGFASEGVLALKGLNLQRLTLRDLPAVDDSAMEVLAELPKLKRLYLHELNLSDSGLSNLKSAKSLELLDIWSVTGLTDATVDVIASLPELKELSLRTTGISDASIEKILSMPKLQTLTLKDNGNVTESGLKKLTTKKWAKLDLGTAE